MLRSLFILYKHKQTGTQACILYIKSAPFCNKFESLKLPFYAID